MPLYQGSVTLAVYFWSDEPRPEGVMQDAKDRLRDMIEVEGVLGEMRVRQVNGIEPIDAGWEKADLVPGSDEITGGERMTLEHAMIFAASLTGQRS